MKRILTIALLVTYLLTFEVVIAEPSSVLPIEGVEMTYREYVSFLTPKEHREAIFELIRRESNWNPDAQNPHSTAYGLFQFLDSTWETVGCEKSSGAQTQIDCGIRYIEERYGDATKALEFHTVNNYY